MTESQVNYLNKAQDKFKFPKRQIFATICSKSIKTYLNWLSLLFL